MIRSGLSLLVDRLQRSGRLKILLSRRRLGPAAHLIFSLRSISTIRESWIVIWTETKRRLLTVRSTSFIALWSNSSEAARSVAGSSGFAKFIPLSYWCKSQKNLASAALSRASFLGFLPFGDVTSLARTRHEPSR